MPADDADQTSSDEDPQYAKHGVDIAHKKSKRNKRSRKKKSSERQRSASAPISREFDEVIDKVTGGHKRDATFKKTRDGEHKTTKHKQSTASKNMKPIHQINPRSYLGSALKDAAQAKPHGKARYSDSDSDDDADSDYDPSSSDDESEDSTDSGTDSSLDHNDSDSSDGSDSSSSDKISGSSDDTSDSYSSSSDSSDSSDSDDGHRKKRKKSSHRKGKKCHRRHKQGSALKPIEPQVYNGEDDTHLFHKLMTQGTDYVVQGKVEKYQQVAVLSNFLSGKAYTFYTHEISFSKKKWELKKFFQELFNYCFPVDFRMRQRKVLSRCYQNNQSVKEYASELNELFVTIGFSYKREQVHKLWNGLCPSLQKALWIDKLNPETSSWKRVVRVAKINEIADSISAPHN
jgi:hypothetical protein